MIAARARFLVTAFWVGSLWTVGYLVAPTLFATLGDRVLAGTVAGNIFRVEAWVSVGCGLALLLLSRLDKLEAGAVRRPLVGLIVAMLVCTLLGYFGIEPFMAALREGAGPGGVMQSAVRTRFGILHGLSSAFYLAESLFGVLLLLRTR